PMAPSKLAAFRADSSSSRCRPMRHEKSGIVIPSEGRLNWAKEREVEGPWGSLQVVGFVSCVLALLAPFGTAQTPSPTLQEKLGYPASAKLLIIHADDLGMVHSVNRATLAALE